MQNRRLVFFVSLVFLMGLVSGIAGATPEYGGRLVVAHPLTPPHLDTDKTTDSNVGIMMFHVFEGLFELDSTYKPVPHLAERYTRNDAGTVYEFFLREDVVFHDGSNMTAMDAHASFLRYLANNGAGRNMAPFIEEVTVTGTYSFKVSFSVPYAPFLYFLASPVANQKFVVRPKGLVDRFGDGVMTEFIGTGPFAFSGWIPDQYVRLTRFADYSVLEKEPFGYSGKKIAYVDELTFQIVTEQSLRVAGVTTGQYAFSDAAPREQLPLFEKNAQLVPHVVRPYRQAFLILNMGNPPFNDIRARQALLHAIDIEEFGYTVVGDPDFWFLNPSLFPPGHIFHVPNAGANQYMAYDLNKAKGLLAESGYDGTPIIILNSREDAIESRSALVLQSQLERAGFRVDVRLYDRATVVEQRARKDGFHLHFSQFFSPDPDPQVYGAWMGTRKWIGNWEDEDALAMDDIFARMLVETDFPARYAIVEEWHEAFYHYVPYVKLYDFSQLRLAHRSLQGYQNFVFPTFFNVWLSTK